MNTAPGMSEKDKRLSRFGFSFERGGAHIARTMMLEDLRALLACVDRTDADKNEYLHAIENDNCLRKRSAKTRKLTYRHLVDLYSLDRTKLLFRSLLYFWKRDVSGQPLLALLCTFSRDTVFRASAPFILSFSEGSIVTRESLEEFIESRNPGRFSKATLKSTAQNINGTWTKSGHLRGRARKVRVRALPTAGSVAYALLLGYLTGARGQALFQTPYAKLLDCPLPKSVEFAEEASRKGWIVFKRVGEVMEILFPNLINQEEMEWIREQD